MSSLRGRGVWRSVLADVTPLRRFPDYRRLWIGQTLSSIGQQMTTVAVAVQVYEITGSSFSVGLVGLCSLVPLVVFGLYGGAVADRVDRRRLGLGAAAGLAAMSVLLGAQAVAGLRQVWPLYLVVAAQGAFFALSSPARQAMIPRLLPPEQLPAANALSSVTLNLGMTVGPMLGALFVGAWGFQAAYLADAATFCAALYGLWRLPPMPPLVAEGAARAGVLDGLRFLRSRPNVRMTFLTDIAAMVFGSPRALYPALAASVYGGGARTVGWLAAAPAVGALTGAVFSGWLTRIRHQGRAVVLAVVAWGAAIAAVGLTTSLWVALALLAVAGAADTVSMVFRNTIMQVNTPDEMRGRLAGVFVVVVAGGPRLGDFTLGAIGSVSTERVALVAGGAAVVVCVAGLTARWFGFWRYDALKPEA